VFEQLNASKVGVIRLLSVADDLKITAITNVVSQKVVASEK